MLFSRTNTHYFPCQSVILSSIRKNVAPWVCFFFLVCRFHHSNTQKLKLHRRSHCFGQNGIFFSQLCDNWRVTMMMTTTRCNNNTSNKCAIGIFSQYFCRLKITALHIVLHMGDTNSHFYFSFLLFFFAALLFNPYGHIGIFFYIPNPMHGRARWRNVNISFSLSDWQL